MCGCSKIFYTTVAIVLLCQLSIGCPSQCVCKWKNGKQTVECNDKSLLSIPGGMDPGTQVLDFSGNSLHELHSEIFLKMDLINLQRLYLSRCRIHSIDDRTFKGLTNLVELDLSGNLLETVPADAFADCPSLMRLTLNTNPIKVIKRAAFTHLSFLNTLELSDCEISDVEEDAFQGLHSLEWLRVDGNQLRTIRGEKVLPENLRGAELQGNPWECDCHLLDFYSWLESFSIPHSVEPVCSGPPRLARRAVKSISPIELACLPDVSPTTLYLEIGEGKNISLMCNVRAIPEARVSWWFQGQHLQNDTIVSPGYRLLYFIEEGSEDKRSELFIYNTNSEDNGTFVCSAENSAGTVSSNYTIRIIVKEEPIVIIVTFPFEYVLAAVIGTAAFFIVVLVIIILCVIKCRRNRKRIQKREKTKEVALQYQQNITKCSVTVEDNIEQLSDTLKQNINDVDRQQDIMFYSPPLCKDVLRTMSPVAVANQMRSPISLRRYQLEQNPDLINDTESVSRRKDGDGEDDHDSITAQTEQINSMIHPSLVQFPISCMRGSRKLYSLHSWDAGCSLDSDGYPADYGLPKIQNVAQSNENFYRTLPYNRAAKRQSAANPLSRYSREAEFLSRSSQPAPYEHYCPDVRYTADGYPARPGDTDLPVTLIPSPPEGYKSEVNAPSSLPCTSTTTVHWPPCVPANLHMINSSLECNQSKYANISKRCVGAQTETSSEPSNATTNKTESTLNINSESPNETLTESPDEGYEGEPGVVL